VVVNFDSDDVTILLGTGATVPQPFHGTSVALIAIAPNPVRGQASIAFRLPVAARARVELFDATGRRVATLSDAAQSAGRNEVVWSVGETSPRLAAGVYYVQLQANGHASALPVILIK